MYLEKIKHCIRNIFGEKQLIIIDHNDTKTIKINSLTQIIFYFCALCGIIFIAIIIIISAKFYSKIDKKQRKIDQMIQDQEVAKDELSMILDRFTQINNHFALINKSQRNLNKKEQIEPNETKNSDNKQNDSGEINKDSEDYVKSSNNLIESIGGDNSNMVNSQDNEVSSLFETVHKMHPNSDLKNIIISVKHSIYIWYKDALMRYNYIYSILNNLNIVNCEVESFSQNVFGHASDVLKAIKKFATTGSIKYSHNELVTKMRYKVCKDIQVNKIQNQSFNQLVMNKSFISSLIQLEKLFVNIPIGNPMTNGQLGSGFGWRKDPVHGNRAMHAGIDIRGPYGAKIYASADGNVIRSGWAGGYGLLIDIEHKYGVITRYAHLKSTFVRTGQSVKAGTLIGLEGSSGKATGPHLHYEIRINNLAINPIQFVKSSR